MRRVEQVKALLMTGQRQMMMMMTAEMTQNLPCYE